MLSSLKHLLKGNTSTLTALSASRFKALSDAFGEPDLVNHDTDQAQPIDIYAFGRNFVEECDNEATDDDGYVLVTSGMSDFMMPLPANCEDESPAAELIWYVRDLNPEYFKNLRWLAKLPSIDQIWIGMGHTVPMPSPPLSFCEFSTFLFLPPIIRTDRQVFDGLEQQGNSIATLAVHLLSPQEYELVKTADGLDQFLDLLDEHDYPFIFDPKRESLL